MDQVWLIAFGYYSRSVLINEYKCQRQQQILRVIESDAANCIARFNFKTRIIIVYCSF